jgi:hypothetical protein
VRVSCRPQIKHQWIMRRCALQFRRFDVRFRQIADISLTCTFRRHQGAAANSLPGLSLPRRRLGLTNHRWSDAFTELVGRMR